MGSTSSASHAVFPVCTLLLCSFYLTFAQVPGNDPGLQNDPPLVQVIFPPVRPSPPPTKRLTNSPLPVKKSPPSKVSTPVSKKTPPPKKGAPQAKAPLTRKSPPPSKALPKPKVPPPKKPLPKVPPLPLISYRDRLLVLLNLVRLNKKLPPLCLNKKLSTAAVARARDMARLDYFDHITPQGLSPGVFIGEAGYRNNGTILGENIAAGYQTPEAVITVWQQSRGDLANVLAIRFKHVGFGRFSSPLLKNKYGTYWVATFGSSPLERCD